MTVPERLDSGWELASDVPVDAELAVERIPEPEFPQLPEIKLVVPVVPETPTPWSLDNPPIPDSIFRTEEPEPAQPQPAEEPAPESVVESTLDDDSVIVDDRTPADLNRQSASRDKKALTIVLSLAIAMVGIVAIALFVIVF